MSHVLRVGGLCVLACVPPDVCRVQAFLKQRKGTIVLMRGFRVNVRI